MAQLDLKNLDQLEVKTEPMISKPVQFGLIILIVFVGGFLLWSSLAPLESAAVAEGKVTLDGNRKTIQHLEGGIVKKIYVKEGSQVNANDLLIQLDTTQPQASLDSIQTQVNELLAQVARLSAQRDHEKVITFPERLLKQKEDPVVSKIIKAQQQAFVAESETLTGQDEILRQRMVQSEQEIKSLDAQVDSETKQLALINEEIVAVQYLEKKQLIEKPRLLALQREAARLIGNRGEHLGLIAKAHEKIGETKTQLLTLKSDNQKQTLDQLREAQQKLSELLEKEKSAQDILNRTSIRAPQEGVVVGLKEHTLGGVIKPGDNVLDIVPSDDKLVIEARVNPLDIDVVHKGLPAKVHLSAYKARSTPALDGTVDYVSADSFTEEKSGQTYYLAKITIEPDELAKLKHVKLYPGMPAQVMIITERATAFRYFISPLKESFRRAFREQ